VGDTRKCETACGLNRCPFGRVQRAAQLYAEHALSTPTVTNQLYRKGRAGRSGTQLLAAGYFTTSASRSANMHRRSLELSKLMCNPDELVNTVHVKNGEIRAQHESN